MYVYHSVINTQKGLKKLYILFNIIFYFQYCISDKIQFIFIFPSNIVFFSIYIYIYHSWKKVGILATGCRRLGGKNDPNWQKRLKICKNQRKIRRNGMCNFLVASCSFSRYDIYILIVSWFIVINKKNTFFRAEKIALRMSMIL